MINPVIAPPNQQEAIVNFFLTFLIQPTQKQSESQFTLSSLHKYTIYKGFRAAFCTLQRTLEF